MGIRVIRRFITGVVFLILYIIVVIPLTPYLLSIVTDFVNNSNFLKLTYNTVEYKYDPSCDCFVPYPSQIQIDLRPVVMFLAQFTVYFLLPLLAILGVFRR